MCYVKYLAFGLTSGGEIVCVVMESRRYSHDLHEGGLEIPGLLSIYFIH